MHSYPINIFHCDFPMMTHNNSDIMNSIYDQVNLYQFLSIALIAAAGTFSIYSFLTIYIMVLTTSLGARGHERL